MTTVVLTKASPHQSREGLVWMFQTAHPQSSQDGSAPPAVVGAHVSIVANLGRADSQEQHGGLG